MNSGSSPDSLGEDRDPSGLADGEEGSGCCREACSDPDSTVLDSSAPSGGSPWESALGFLSLGSELAAQVVNPGQRKSSRWLPAMAKPTRTASTKPFSTSPEAMWSRRWSLVTRKTCAPIFTDSAVYLRKYESTLACPDWILPPYSQASHIPEEKACQYLCTIASSRKIVTQGRRGWEAKKLKASTKLAGRSVTEAPAPAEARMTLRPSMTTSRPLLSPRLIRPVGRPLASA